MFCPKNPFKSGSARLQALFQHISTFNSWMLSPNWSQFWTEAWDENLQALREKLLQQRSRTLLDGERWGLDDFPWKYMKVQYVMNMLIPGFHASWAIWFFDHVGKQQLHWCFTGHLRLKIGRPDAWTTLRRAFETLAAMVRSGWFCVTYPLQLIWQIWKDTFQQMINI